MICKGDSMLVQCLARSSTCSWLCRCSLKSRGETKNRL